MRLPLALCLSSTLPPAAAAPQFIGLAEGHFPQVAAVDPATARARAVGARDTTVRLINEQLGGFDPSGAGGAGVVFFLAANQTRPSDEDPRLVGMRCSDGSVVSNVALGFNSSADTPWNSMSAYFHPTRKVMYVSASDVVFEKPSTLYQYDTDTGKRSVVAEFELDGGDFEFAAALDWKHDVYYLNDKMSLRAISLATGDLTYLQPTITMRTMRYDAGRDVFWGLGYHFYKKMTGVVHFDTKTFNATWLDAPIPAQYLVSYNQPNVYRDMTVLDTEKMIMWVVMQSNADMLHHLVQFDLNTLQVTNDVLLGDCSHGGPIPTDSDCPSAIYMQS